MSHTWSQGAKRNTASKNSTAYIFSIWYINFRLGLYYGCLIKKGGFKEYEKDCLRNPILGNITKFWHNNDYEGFHYHVTAGLS